MSSNPSHKGRQPSRALLGLVLAVALASAAVLASASLAPAATVTNRSLLFSFDGSDTTAGKFSTLRALEVDQANGWVYAIDEGNNVLDKFNLEGEAEEFSSTGSSSLDPGFLFNEFSDVAVDNSSVNPGRILIAPEKGPVKALVPSGETLWQLAGFQENCGLTVDSAGHPWVSDFQTANMLEFDNTGSPPKEISSVRTESPCRLDLDSSGNVYVAKFAGKVSKYVGGVFEKEITDDGAYGISVDQLSANGHVFTIGRTSSGFSEFTPSGSLVGHFGSGGNGIAYDHELDRVYIARGSEIQVWGPATAVTVPDLTINPVTSESLTTAHFSGTVNALGHNNTYHFEYHEVGGSTFSTPDESVPVDKNPHAVSADVSGLSPNTQYRVKLVAENTEAGFKNETKEIEFGTGKSAIVTIDDPAAVTTSSVHVSGSVDPRESEGSARFQLSTDPKCDEGVGFSNSAPPHAIAENAGPTAVEDDLTGLLPSQDYCLRLAATNSSGTTFSAIKQFTTLAVAPDEVVTEYAAPRTDTTARLNGLANPEGEVLSYRFEYKPQSASTWTLAPSLEDTSEAKEQTILAEEISGLTPSTAYEYRLLVENPAGEAAQQGQIRTFTTRSTAEVAAPNRGYELVNPGEKGNQNIRTEIAQRTSSISPDGERAVWNVLGGAPNANSGSGASFISERTPQGWTSRSLIPPAEEQFAEGEAGGYLLDTTTPTLSSFVFNAGTSGAERGRRLVRVDDHQHQTFLREYPAQVEGGKSDLTDDGAHVFFVNQTEPRQLEDLGSGSPEVVSIMPDGEPNECGLANNEKNSSFAGGGNDPVGAAVQWQPGYHMIATTDGSRVYFQAKANSGPCGPAGRWGIYERNRESEETVLVDGGTGSHSPEFIRATPDGGEAYFATYSNLDAADTNSDADVYLWHEESGESSCLTCVVPDADLATFGAVLRKVLVSDDLSHIYFESTKQLVPGEGKAGEGNVYVLSDGQVRFVVDPNSIDTLRGNTQLSTDGNTLLFSSDNATSAHQQLTADKLAPTCVRFNNINSLPCKEIFRYDDRDQSLECLSCRRGGITTNNVGTTASASEHGFQMSADGSTVAFVTKETLVPLDVNHGIDIYEWRNGVVRLITDGVTSYAESLTASPQANAVSETGRDIFVTLVAPGLTGFERDRFANLYDARSGGGFPVPNPPAHCSEESCQGPLQAAPGTQPAASANADTRGNLSTNPARRPCAKKRGKAKQRCQRAHKHKGNGKREMHHNGRAAR